MTYVDGCQCICCDCWFSSSWNYFSPQSWMVMVIPRAMLRSLHIMCWYLVFCRKLLRSQLTERERRLVGYSVLSFFLFSFGAAICGGSGVRTTVSPLLFVNLLWFYSSNVGNMHVGIIGSFHFEKSAALGDYRGHEFHCHACSYFADAFAMGTFHSHSGNCFSSPTRRRQLVSHVDCPPWYFLVCALQAIPNVPIGLHSLFIHAHDHIHRPDIIVHLARRLDSDLVERNDDHRYAMLHRCDI